MAQVIRVSKQGEDAISPTNQNSLLVDTQYNTFKIVDTGVGTLTCGTGFVTKEIVHNYGTRQAFMVFFKYPNDRASFMWSPTDSATGTSSIYVSPQLNIRNNTGTISVDFNNTTAGTLSVSYRYYLFEIPL